MTSTCDLLVFPHQLFRLHPGLGQGCERVWLIEDGLFFGDHRLRVQLHQQKLWLHRASMKHYEQWLRSEGVAVEYIEHEQGLDVLDQTVQKIAASDSDRVAVTEPHDYLLERRLRRLCSQHGIELKMLATPMFLNSPEQNRTYREGKKRWFMADFYKHQRKRLDVLMEDGEPAGGQWSFDGDNRKKVPKKLLSEIPELILPERDSVDQDARAHILNQYPDHPGALDHCIYPTTHEQAAEWLSSFLDQRFGLFGDYEDAMVKGQNWLWHGVLTPMMNIGLLTPRQVVGAALDHADRNDVPLNSLEGFIRQIIGWREFMRATYDDLGVEMRTGNHWNHERPMPSSFYDATTGIDPIDDVIRRVLDTGYCHHIERLMILGGFMFLCEIHPDEIYTWFMEMFVDSYDWVMVPNVYAMSQHADGGLITTKPYFSGSSYVKKMSNHPAGNWTSVWDGLYWSWIMKHAGDLAKNPRWAMMCSMARKMDPAKRQDHQSNADAFLRTLDGAG